MKSKFFFLFIFNIFLWNHARTQGHLNAFLDKTHFETWARQQHKEICKMLFTDLVNGKLQGYNADHGKLSKDQMSQMLENVATYDTLEGIKDPVKVIDAIIQNFDFFETIVFTGNLIHIHAVNTVEGISTEDYKRTGSSSAHIIDFYVEAGAFENQLNTAQQLYISIFRRDSSLASTGISKISTELFSEIFSKLFHESFTTSNLYANAELNILIPIGDRKNINLAEIAESLPHHPDEPSEVYDTIYYKHLTPLDTSVKQKIAISIRSENLHFDIAAIGCWFEGIRNPLFGNMGFLNYKTESNLELKEKALIESIICKQLIDGLMHDP